MTLLAQNSGFEPVGIHALIATAALEQVRRRASGCPGWGTCPIRRLFDEAVSQTSDLTETADLLGHLARNLDDALASCADCRDCQARSAAEAFSTAVHDVLF